MVVFVGGMPIFLGGIAPGHKHHVSCNQNKQLKHGVFPNKIDVHCDLVHCALVVRWSEISPPFRVAPVLHTVRGCHGR